MTARLRCLSLFVLLAIPAATMADNGARDPWEGFNRKVYAFNDWIDTWLARPLARGYQFVTPEFVDNRVTRFFANLGDVTNAANLALQGEGKQALDSTGRVMANSTLGLAGLFDVASAGGIPRRETSFGTTLGKWGVSSGNYLVLPFLGPSTVRDAAGVPVDWAFGPVIRPWTLFDDDATRYGLQALDLVDTRADLLQLEEAVVGDRYAFLRDIYLQRRDFTVEGATSTDPFLDEDFEDEDADGEPTTPDAGEGSAADLPAE